MFNKFRSNKNKQDDEENVLNNHSSSSSNTATLPLPITAADQPLNKKHKAKSFNCKTKSKKNNDILAPPAPTEQDVSAISAPTALYHEPVPEGDLKFYQGGVRKKYRSFIKWIGRIGFVAKGVVYGCIGVLTLTNLSGAWTPNGSEGNESPQGAFLLLGGIPSVGRSILIVMAIGLCLYIIWRMWEAITGQGSDASYSKKKNFFRYRLSPFVSGLVYTAYTYYIIQMIFQTEEEQQHLASSETFPASWSSSTLGKAGIGILGIAFLIAFITQFINCVTGNFIKDLKTSEPGTCKWEALIVHTLGRIGFGGRAALFGTMSGFFWDSLVKQNESGDKNMVAAAVGKLATTGGGRFFMGLLGVCLVIYAMFAVLNSYYKYFPTPAPSRKDYYTADIVHPEISDSESSSNSGRSIIEDGEHVSPAKQVERPDREKEQLQLNNDNDQPKRSLFARYIPFKHKSDHKEQDQV